MEDWQGGLSVAVDEADWARAVDILLQQAHDGALPLGEDERARRAAFDALITRLCEAGQNDLALRLADVDYYPVEYLKTIALADLGSGRHAAADRLLQLPTESGLQLTEAASALADVAVHMGQHGHADAALELLQRAGESGWKSSAEELAPHALAPLAVAYARLGKFDQAHRVLEGFSQAADETWYEIAREQMRQGRASEAGHTIDKIHNTTRRRHAQVELALRQKDKTLAQSIVDEAERVRRLETRLTKAYPELDTILVALAQEYLHAGRTVDGLAYIADIGQPQLRTMEMAQALLDSGDVDGAVALTEGMDGSTARDRALLANVAKIAGRGDIEAARRALEGIVNADTRDRARASMVEAQCRQQDFEGAFHTLHSIQSEKHMALPLGTLMTDLYQSERSAAAYKLMSQIPRSLLAALEPLVRAQLARQDREGLKQVLPRGAESLASAWRVCTAVAVLCPGTVLPLSEVAIRY